MEANRSEGFRYGCLVNNMSMETAGHNEKLALKNAIQFDSWLVEIAKTIKEGQEAGEFRNDYEAKDLADFIHSNLYGALSREKMLRSANTTQKNLEKTLRFLEDK
ncbi:MAG: TetR family transcriptional regulator C-terminal domain-containing protein [Bacteroidia bacterium]|nr:TetR family transcriptional regulator C-terminal domain-containing protein [Bacteroidia bacterium]